jgi:DNA-binding LytR/AlgR family response regulator
MQSKELALQYGAGQFEMVWDGDTPPYYFSVQQNESSINQAHLQIVLNRQYSDVNMLHETYGRINQVFEAQGSLDSVGFYLPQQSGWLKLTSHETRAVAIVNAQFKHELSEMNNQMSASADEMESSNFLLRMALAASLVIGIFLVFEFIRNRRKKKLGELQRVFLYSSIESQAEQITQLKSQIDQYKKLSTSTSKIFILKNKVNLEIDNIVYIESKGHYISINKAKEKEPLLERFTLKEILEEQPGIDFVQIHKSYIVNVAYIKEIRSSIVWLSTKKSLPVSRTFKSGLVKILHNLNHPK